MSKHVIPICTSITQPTCVSLATLNAKLAAAFPSAPPVPTLRLSQSTESAMTVLILVILAATLLLLAQAASMDSTLLEPHALLLVQLEPTPKTESVSADQDTSFQTTVFQNVPPDTEMLEVNAKNALITALVVKEPRLLVLPV